MHKGFNPTEADICVVDDDPSLLDSIQKLLASAGLAARLFDKPEAFLTYIAANPASLVVLDIWMEKVNGLEVLARMCALSPATPVIIITARNDVAARTTAMQFGPVAYLIKPFDGDEFLAAACAAVRRPKTARASSSHS
jgi:DNA-binding response OmpR family regulator